MSQDALVAPFFDPSRCPICAAALPPGPLRCPACGDLRRADSLVDRMRADLAPTHAPELQPEPHVPVGQPPVARQSLPEVAAARSWFAGRSVGVIVLVLGALCVLAAGTIFIAVTWVRCR